MSLDTHIFSFYYPEINIEKPYEVLLIPRSHSLFSRIVTILRMKVGDEFIFFDGKKYSCLVKLASISKASLSIKILEKRQIPLNKKNITLYVPLLDFDYMKEVLYIGGQQGVQRIIFVETEKSKKKLYTEKEYAKLMTYVINGCEQGRQFRIPECPYHKVFFSDLLNPLYLTHCYTFFELGTCSLSRVIGDKALSPAIFCGPEAGFTEKEKDSLKNALNHSLISLSDSILRSVDVFHFATIFFSSF